ncbi:LOW QUALITY PROTEIN: hypothetical protein TorRG33x02_104810 [Trema orientale]|uniref:Uncharacterized protein n=1 Tax=Trema orientale TaxID=63057 RepID=A0A2P5F7J4_TREOI|nr:LOW QUALITY PROTEIN: hypothetical protein TorRG33x02_104810 [Trema orientale]
MISIFKPNLCHFSWILYVGCLKVGNDVPLYRYNLVNFHMNSSLKRKKKTKLCCLPLDITYVYYHMISLHSIFGLTDDFPHALFLYIYTYDN